MIPWLYPVIVNAYDGNIYIIDGSTGCSDRIDIGESSYSMVLVDDFLGNNKLQLVTTSRNGNIFVLGTDIPYHPLKTW